MGQTDRQTDRQTDMQAGRQAGRQADRQTDRQAGRQTDRQTETRENNRDREREKDRERERQRERKTERERDRQRLLLFGLFISFTPSLARCFSLSLFLSLVFPPFLPRSLSSPNLARSLSQTEIHALILAQCMPVTFPLVLSCRQTHVHTNCRGFNHERRKLAFRNVDTHTHTHTHLTFSQPPATFVTNLLTEK